MSQTVPVSWPLIFVLLGSLGLPLGVPPLPETQLLSKIAPEECLFYMSSAGMAAADAKSQNQTEQLLAEPEVQKAVGKVVDLVKAKAIGAIDAQLPADASSEDPKELMEAISQIIVYPAAVYISEIQLTPGGPNIRGGAAFRVGGDLEKFKGRIEEITKFLLHGQKTETLEIGGEKWQSFKPAPNMTVVWGFKKNFFVAAAGEGEMESLLKRAGGNAPEWLAKIRRDLPVERVSTVGFLNVKGLLKIFVPAAGPQAAVVLEALGISNVNNVATVAGLDQSNYISRIQIAIDGEPQGLMQFASIKPLSAEDLAAIPADARMALAAKINPLGIFNSYMAMVEKADPQAASEMHRGIEQAESQLGLRIGEEILKPLGENVLYYSALEGGMPKMMAVVQVKDHDQAAKSFAKLMPMIQAKFEEAAKNSPLPMKLEKTAISGKEAYVISVQQPGMPGGQVCWCLTEKEIIIALSPQSIETYLSPAAEFKSLGQSPEVAKLFAGGAGPTSLVYWNIQETIKQIYPALPMIAALLQPQGIKLDLSMLPPQDAIVPHLTPLVSSVRRTKSGIEIDERAPLPGLGIAASSPIVAALMLPGIQAGREAARRAQSINNMKQIILAMHNYHDANKRFPPAFKADKEGKPLLSWRVLILPYLGHDDLYKEFHLDEPWDSEHNKKLIAKMPPEYRSPNSLSGEGKTNYLTIRGGNTVFPGNQGVRMADISDGTAFTIAVVEAADEKAVIWTKPDDFEMDASNPLKGLTGLHPNIFLAAFADGSVHELSVGIDPKVLEGLFSRNGGEVVEGKF